MRRVLLISIYIFVCLTLTACQEGNILSGNVKVPPSVAGTWKAEDNPWKITIDSKGKLSSAKIAMGEVNIKPNQAVEVEMKDGSISTFQAGDCIVDYNPEKRELYVSVKMKHINIKFFDDVIEGGSEDIFVGPVSEDGKRWETTWMSYFDYGDRFPMDPNAVGEPLTFLKVDE